MSVVYVSYTSTKGTIVASHTVNIHSTQCGTLVKHLYIAQHSRNWATANEHILGEMPETNQDKMPY